MVEVLPGESSASLDTDGFATLTTLEGTIVIETAGTKLALPTGRTCFLPPLVAGAAISGTGRAIAVLPASDDTIP